MKKILAVFLGMLMMLSMIVACSNPKKEMEYDFSESNETISYRFFSPGFQDFEGKENDRVIKFLEKKFNIKIKLSGASSSWEQRLQTEIYDGNTPDLFFTVPSTGSFGDFIRREVITDIGPYVEKAQATNLQNMLNAEPINTASLIGDKHYFVPQPTGISNHTLYVRRDWMNKWNEARGAKTDTKPETLSEFTEMLKYFVSENLSGGRQTYGLSLSSNIDFYKDFMGTFGIVPDIYKDADGKHQYSVFTEKYREMMDWFRTGVAEKYVYPDFYIMSADENLTNFLQGRCGAVIANGDSNINGVITQMRTLNPDNYQNMVGLLPMPNSDDGKSRGAFKGWDWYWGAWNISSDAPEPMRLVRLLDYLFSPEGQKLLVYGVENIHYTEKDGEIIPNYAERLEDGAVVFRYPDSHKPSEPGGRYSVGERFLPVPFEIKDGKLVENIPSHCFLSPELIEQSYAYTAGTDTNPPNYSAVRILISDSKANSANVKILDAITTFTFNYISGKDYDSEKETLMGICNNNNNMKTVLDWLDVNNQ